MNSVMIMISIQYNYDKYLPVLILFDGTVPYLYLFYILTTLSAQIGLMQIQFHNQPVFDPKLPSVKTIKIQCQSNTCMHRHGISPGYIIIPILS